VKYADIHLPYFKQGDDLGHHLSKCSSVEEALEAHAQQLEYAADLLRKIKGMVAGQGVSIDADTHMIQVSGPDEIIDALVDAKYASRQFDEDEEVDDVEDGDSDGGEREGWDSVF
jgi:hypothetical protein